MAEYKPDSAKMSLLKGRLAAILVIAITQILVVKFGVKVDAATKEMILEFAGIIIEFVGVGVTMALCALSKFLEKQKLAASG